MGMGSLFEAFQRPGLHPPSVETPSTPPAKPYASDGVSGSRARTVRPAELDSNDREPPS